MESSIVCCSSSTIITGFLKHFLITACGVRLNCVNDSAKSDSKGKEFHDTRPFEYLFLETTFSLPVTKV